MSPLKVHLSVVPWEEGVSKLEAHANEKKVMGNYEMSKCKRIIKGIIIPQKPRQIEQCPLIWGHHPWSYALNASTWKWLMSYPNVPCDKLHMNSGLDKPNYKCIFIYKHYAMKSKIPQSNYWGRAKKVRRQSKGVERHSVEVRLT